MNNMSGLKPGKYVRVQQGLHQGGKMVPVEEWYSHVSDHSKDWYRSIGTYTADQVQTFKSQKHLLKPGALGDGAVRGITGVSTDLLILDFDNKEDLEGSRKAALDTIKNLAVKGINSNQYNITFTGSKGFTIEMYLDKEYSSKELKNVAENLAGKSQEWDTSMYDENQLLRIPGTRHQDTGFYKTPLTEKELNSLTIDQIKLKAKSFGEMEWNEFPNTIPVELLKPKFKAPVKLKVAPIGELDFSIKPADMPDWKFAILHGFFPPGSRHDCMLALASFYKGMGYPQELTIQLVLGASRLQYDRYKNHYGSDPTDDGELTRTIEHIYGPTWTGGTFAYETNEKLKASVLALFPEETFEVEDQNTNYTKSIKDIIKGFKNFAENIDKNRIYTGIPELDERMMLTTGMPVAILGAPGSAKTSLVINMLSNTSNMGLHSMFFSLDMSDNLVGAKLVARETRIGFRELTEMYKAGVSTEDFEEKVYEDFKNVTFYGKSATTVDEMRKAIKRHEKAQGIKVKFVVVDYLELLHGPYSDLTANSANHAVKLKDLATDLEICLIILVQPQKSAGDASQPLMSMRQVKGASILEQNFRCILGIYREGFSPDNPHLDKFLTIKGLKSTLESLFTVDVGWDGVTGRVYTLDADGHRKLKLLREQKELEKEEKKKSEWD